MHYLTYPGYSQVKYNQLFIKLLRIYYIYVNRDSWSMWKILKAGQCVHNIHEYLYIYFHMVWWNFKTTCSKLHMPKKKLKWLLLLHRLGELYINLQKSSLASNTHTHRTVANEYRARNKTWNHALLVSTQN